MIHFYITSLAFAKQFHKLHHRHLPIIIGHKFSIAAILHNKTIGVITVGRCSSRLLDSSSSLEITRCTSLGARNLCSQLYSQAIRYISVKYPSVTIIYTYTRIDEISASVKASNFNFDCICKGKQWTGRQPHEIIDKIRWSYSLIHHPHLLHPPFIYN